MNKERNWDILIIGGASGSGKSSISYPIARYFGVNLVEADDFQVLLEAMTTAEALPSIHYWNTHPEWEKEGVSATVGQLVNVGEALIPGLEAVVNNHIESKVPMVLEGDFILPEWAARLTARTDCRVKAFFVYEPQEEQILKNYLAREGSVQEYRAQVSFAYGNWLKESCAETGVPLVESRPWENLFERVADKF